MPPPAPENLTLFSSLAGGILDAIDNSLLAVMNDNTKVLGHCASGAHLAG